jgi:hypothetical protein
MHIAVLACAFLLVTTTMTTCFTDFKSCWCLEMEAYNSLPADMQTNTVGGHMSVPLGCFTPKRLGGPGRF